MAIKDHRMIVIRPLMAALLGVTFSLFGTSAFAITFDHRFIADASVFESGVPDHNQPLGNGWFSYLPNGMSQNGTYYYGQFAPDGTNYDLPRDQVAYFDLEVRGDVYPVGMQQTLAATLETFTRYDLSVAVGNPKSGGIWDYTDFGGYRIELLAGDTVIAADETSASPGEGLFDTASLFVESGGLVGGDSIIVGSDLILTSALLGIRLIHRNAGENSDPDILWGIAFDEVELTVSAVPIPAAVWLFGTALFGLFGFSKRRKTA